MVYVQGRKLAKPLRNDRHVDGDVRDFVRMLCDNAEMNELMTDDEVRIGCFGSDASNEEVASRIL